MQARLKQSTHHHQLEEVEALQKTVGESTELNFVIHTAKLCPTQRILNKVQGLMLLALKCRLVFCGMKQLYATLDGMLLHRRVGLLYVSPVALKLFSHQQHYKGFARTNYIGMTNINRPYHGFRRHFNG